MSVFTDACLLVQEAQKLRQEAKAAHDGVISGKITELKGFQDDLIREIKHLLFQANSIDDYVDNSVAGKPESQLDPEKIQYHLQKIKLMQKQLGDIRNGKSMGDSTGF